MTTLLATIFVIGFLVFVHELGHFLVAKAQGVQVYEFAIGFGKILFERQHGETKYQIRAIPFGGFVNMKGEEIEDVEQAEEDPEALSPYEDPRSLASKSVLGRFGVFIAGPFMNLITAGFLIMMVSLIGTQQAAFTTEPAVAGWVYPGSSAAEAGIQSGDVVTAVAGEDVATWEDFAAAIGARAGSEVTLQVRRNGETFEATVTPEARQGDDGAIYAGILPNMEPAVENVLPGGAAAEAGMESGDTIVAVDGTPVKTWSHLVYLIQQHADQETPFTVRRTADGREVQETLTVTPRSDSAGTAKVGIMQGGRTVTRRYGLVDSVVRGVVRPFEISWQILAGIGRLVSGQQSISEMGGPVMIAQAAGNVASNRGFIALLSFTAFISLNFFVLNLLPIPVLDGGHIMFLLPELVTGKVVSSRVRGYANIAGFLLLISLMLFITAQDINRLTGLTRLLGLE